MTLIQQPSFTPGMSSMPTSSVEVSISCKNLADMDTFSKSDPFAVLYIKDISSRRENRRLVLPGTNWDHRQHTRSSVGEEVFYTCLLVWFSVALDNLRTLYWIWCIFLPTSFRGKRLLIRWQTVSEWQGIIIHCDKITYKKWKWNKT